MSHSRAGMNEGKGARRLSEPLTPKQMTTSREFASKLCARKVAVVLGKKGATRQSRGKSQRSSCFTIIPAADLD